MYLLPTSYFPSITFFQQAIGTSSAFISGKEIYVKQSFRNRCEILTANGVQVLSIPVIKVNGTKTETSDIKISEQKNWRLDHWRAIESAYKNAPYFEFYDVEIKNLLFHKTENLFELNQNIIDFLCSVWDLKKPENSNELLVNVDQIEFLGRIKDCSPYKQVFDDRFGFQSNLSALDLLFCEGPLGRNWII